jgi:hypothetical protein
VAKDRAAPFSKKHRRYWIPVTGGMILIGIINVAIGLCSYKEAPTPQRIDLQIPERHPAPVPVDAAGTIGARQLPAEVMRTFALKYPKTIPAGARVDGDTFTVYFPPGAAHAQARFHTNGDWIDDQ